MSDNNVQEFVLYEPFAVYDENGDYEYEDIESLFRDTCLDTEHEVEFMENEEDDVEYENDIIYSYVGLVNTQNNMCTISSPENARWLFYAVQNSINRFVIVTFELDREIIPENETYLGMLNFQNHAPEFQNLVIHGSMVDVVDRLLVEQIPILFDCFKEIGVNEIFKYYIICDHHNLDNYDYGALLIKCKKVGKRHKNPILVPIWVIEYVWEFIPENDLRRFVSIMIDASTSLIKRSNQLDRKPKSKEDMIFHYFSFNEKNIRIPKRKTELLRVALHIGVLLRYITFTRKGPDDIYMFQSFCKSNIEDFDRIEKL